MKNIAALFSGHLLIITLLLPFMAGCRAASPIALLQATPRQDYEALLRSRSGESKVFDLKTLSSSLIVKALRYDGEVESRAKLMFQGDPIFSRETSVWALPAKGAPGGRPVVVLMGLFAPDLGEKDVTDALARLRPGLKTPDGRITAPAAIQRYGRDSVFMRDYFPAFNPWEEVFMVQFPPQTGADKNAPPLFILQWPGGTQTVPLGESAGLK